MTPDTLPSATDTHAAQSLQVERTRQLFAGTHRARIAMSLAGCVTLLGLWRDAQTAALVTWAGVLVALLAGQFMLQRAYRRGSTAESDAGGWEWRFTLSSALLGLLWAALPLALAPAGSAPQLLAGMALLALCAGAVGWVGASAPAFYAFTTPALVALVACCLLRAELAEQATAGVLLVFFGWLVVEQRHACGRIGRAVTARLHHEALARQTRVVETSLERSLAEQQLLLELAPVGVVQTHQGRIARINPHLAQMLGHTPAQLLGQPAGMLFWNAGGEPGNGNDRGARALLEQGLGAACEADLELRRRDDRPLWVHLSARLLDADDSSRGHIAVISDITDRREREVVMQRLAHEDPLTGLPNRRLLQDRMQQAFVQAQRRGRLMAVLLVDLDGFKKINDSYGHEVGDDVLVCVAQRLSGCVRGSDTVSRLGGDEFVVLLNDPGRGEDAQIVAEKLIESISTPIRSGSRTLFVSASVGICMFPRDAQDAETMLRRADAAMYRAKQAGRGAWRLHPEASGSDR